MAAQIHQFTCLSDNFGVLIHDPASGATASIDAPEAVAVQRALAERGWTLTDILVTHHHADHVQGIPALKAAFPKARVVGPAKEAGKIPEIAETVAEGDVVAVGKLKAKVIETPGHTAGHVAYWFEADAALFAGDTLFAMGCGRVFETPMAVMWDSLSRLAALPPQTQVYCGHEYTLSNARFAIGVDPANAALAARLKEVEALREAGRPTLPTTIGRELETNPFLRADDPGVRKAVGLERADAAAVFAEVRERKNRG
ncbi:MAG: hydroxyacylglutathione hydrolase [Methylobacteriaceae bacterium]|nr:hydroxyacylglutathione hydrolase [Methylobacteriaceae bacterium]